MNKDMHKINKIEGYKVEDGVRLEKPNEYKIYKEPLPNKVKCPTCK
jgi:hypothetical protein